MNISTIGYWFLESLEGIKKNSKTFFIGLGTMFVVLSLISGLYVLYMNANSFMGDVSEDESKVELFVRGLNDDEVTVILSELYSIDGVSDVEYISEEQAFEKAQQMKINTTTFEKDDGIFPASFVLTVKESKDGNLTPIREAIHGMTRLNEAITNETGFEEAANVIKIAISVKIITWTLLVLVIMMGCFIMMNSIKLALYSRRKEISIMKYVGATDTFTKAPFIIEGIIIALIAAGLTIFMTKMIYGGLTDFAEGNKMFNFLVSSKDVLNSISILLLIVSIGIGTIGSSMSINKYLDV